MRPPLLLALSCGFVVTIFAGESRSQTPAPPPKVWGIVIGIDAYEDAKISTCRGSSGDARAIRRWLVETAGWDGGNILLMEGNSPKTHGPREQQITSLRPSRENLDWAVKEWLPHRVRPGDVVLISFAGQAVGGRDGDPLSRDLLLPIDAKADALEETGWPIQDAIDGIASQGVNQLVMWMDTSLSGRGKPATTLSSRTSDSSRFLMELTRWPGVTAWIAADRQPAKEPAGPSERGAFVSALLPAMGSLDKPGNILGGLFALSRDPRLIAQGFRSAGGLGPEWSFWPKSLASIVRPPSELMLQRGHADRVTSVVFSPDASTMMTASQDSTIKIWRLDDRRLMRTLSSHTIGVTALAMSPDGSRLASGDGAGRVILWTLPELRPISFLLKPPHNQGIASLQFLESGEGFASLDHEGRAVSWRIGNNEITPTLLSASASSLASGENEYAVATLPKPGQPSLHLFDPQGKPLRNIDGPGGFIAASALRIQGDRLLAGNSEGLLGVWNRKDGSIESRIQGDHPVECVEFTEAAAFGSSGNEITVLWRDRMIAPRILDVGGKVANLVASRDGRSLVASTTTGEVFAWNLVDQANLTRIPLEKSPSVGPITAIALSPRNHLVSGDQDGGVRCWSWPDGRYQSRIPPHRGKIEKLAVSPDGRHLAQIDHDRKARIWDLREGRDLLRIRGEWRSMAFLPDGNSLVMSRAEGSIHLVDRATTEVKTTDFLAPKGADGEASRWGFGPVAASANGRMILAGSPHGPLACVWPIEGGEASLTIRDHADRITSVAFSEDSQHLMTSSLDGTIKIRTVGGQKARWTLAAEMLPESEVDPGVTVSTFAPGPLTRVASGHLDGRVLLWDVRGPTPKMIEVGRLAGPVHDVAFTPDGKNLIACGADKSVRRWPLNGEQAPGAARRFLPQHTEQANSIAVWADGKLLATAGDDASIRFWTPDGQTLLGMLATSADDAGWVAFTPEGRFDSAPGSETQVSYVSGDRIMSLDQAEDDSRVFGLGRYWLEGKSPEGRSALLVTRPPPLWLAPPLDLKNGEVVLSVKLTEPGLENVRVYLNNVPVRDADDFRETKDPLQKSVSVQLAAGTNRLAVMASRPGVGGLHGRSNEIVVQGPPVEGAPQGVVHSLSIGISTYRPEANALAFAHRDAEDFAAFLAKHGVGEGGRSGLKLVLRDDQVTPSSVEESLLAIRGRARPEDTVVIFLAGHTDVRRDRFCLLLPSFPLAAGSVNPGDRGPLAATPNPSRDDPKSLIPYATIYRILAKTDALKRLVVIDACQAGAIFDDPGVRRIQDKVDDGAHRARTSYLLATRRGEPAKESATLHHGLLTHLLLRGMGASDLAPEPGGILGDADANLDGTVTTEELRQFVDINLPILTTRVALTGARANPGGKTNATPEPARSQASGATFPLVRIPR